MKTCLSAAIVGSLIAMGTSAVAAPLNCSSINGRSFTATDNIPVSLVTGETLGISTPNNATLAISIEFGGSGGSDDSICNPSFPGAGSCDGLTHTAKLTGEYVIQAFNAPGDQFTVSCGAGVAPTTTAPTGTTAAPNPTAAQTAAQGAGGTVAASGSTTAIGNAISSATGGSSSAISTQGAFLTTGGSGGALQGWAQIQGRKFDGDIDGSSYEFTLGTDFEIGGGARLGLFISQGKADLDINGTSYDSEALSFGPYIKAQIGQNYEVTGYALFAKPDVSVGNLSYDSERRAAGVDVTANYTWGNTQVESFLGLSGFSEDHPSVGGLASRTITGMTGSIGTKAIFATGSALQPYVSLGADFSRYDDGINGRKTHSTPRLGTGFSYQSGAGTLSMDLNGGEILDDTRDVEMRLKYNFNF